MSRSIESMTVGDLRRLMAYDGPETHVLATALANIVEGDRVQGEHEVRLRGYEAYVERRQVRCNDAVEEAAIEANRAAVGDGAKIAARREARAELYEDFQRCEPLLEFQEWIDYGQPDVHALAVPIPWAKRAARRVREALVA